jgi:hypothetical protein
MTAPSKYKWLASLILGGILLVLAGMGGKQETTYAAEAGINATPVIYNIYPTKAPVGSANVMMIISGVNFGEVKDFIRVWIKDPTHNYIAVPIQVIDTGLSVMIPDILLVAPDTYTITVVKSNGLSVPTVPPDPVYDQVSNPATFFVYQPLHGYLPLIRK